MNIRTDAWQPLTGLRILEHEGLGPVPHASMILQSLGADIVRIARPDDSVARWDSTPFAGTRVRVDLKTPAGRREVRELLELADVMIDGFRPRVLERLGLGDATCHAVNDQLILVHASGWATHDPRSTRAGHDINVLATTGALAMMGPSGLPTPPLNLVGDYGAGSMSIVVGVLSAVIDRQRSGAGSVVETSIAAGVATLLEPLVRLAADGTWRPERASNLLDGGAPFYRCYPTADHEFMAVGAIEPAFYDELLTGLGLDARALPSRDDRSNWPALASTFTRRFVQHDRSHWESVFEVHDACVTPVATVGEMLASPRATCLLSSPAHPQRPHYEHRPVEATPAQARARWAAS